eukprot:scpid29120/ scgid3614/ 
MCCVDSVPSSTRLLTRSERRSLTPSKMVVSRGAPSALLPLMVVAMLSLLTSSTHANPVAGKGTDAEEANNSAGAVANPIRTVCPSFTDRHWRMYLTASCRPEQGDTNTAAHSNGTAGSDRMTAPLQGKYLLLANGGRLEYQQLRADHMTNVPREAIFDVVMAPLPADFSVSHYITTVDHHHDNQVNTVPLIRYLRLRRSKGSRQQRGAANAIFRKLSYTHDYQFRWTIFRNDACPLNAAKNRHCSDVTVLTADGTSRLTVGVRAREEAAAAKTGHATTATMMTASPNVAGDAAGVLSSSTVTREEQRLIQCDSIDMTILCSDTDQ